MAAVMEATTAALILLEFQAQQTLAVVEVVELQTIQPEEQAAPASSSFATPLRWHLPHPQQAIRKSPTRGATKSTLGLLLVQSPSKE